MTPEREQRIRQVAAKRQMDLAVVIENVHDVHNIAAVVRTCDAVGINRVYALYTDPQIKTTKLKIGKRTSAGARKWVDVHMFKDMDACMNEVCANHEQVFATALGDETRSIYQCDFLQSTALVFGNEHGGVSDELLKYCTGRIIIPQAGMVQSLNISVACAVTLYEVLRQREAAGFYTDNPTQAGEIKQSLLEDWFERHESGRKGKAMKRRGDF